MYIVLDLGNKTKEKEPLDRGLTAIAKWDRDRGLL